MRGLVALGLTVLAGCDLVFAPGKLSIDADTSHPDAPDGANQPDAATPGEPDARPDAGHIPDASVCSMACLGDHGTSGVAPCAIPRDWCDGTELDTLDGIDLCSCTAGVPALYVFDVVAGTSMMVAFTPASSGVTYYLSVDGNGCFAPDLACAIGNICGSPGSILTYRNAVPSGAPQTFRLWSDDACSIEQVALFEWFP